MSLNNYSKYNKGMTLVELMVVLSIFAIISSMVIFNYSDYKSNVNIKVLSDDIALSIRQAQAYAIGVKSVNGEIGSSFPGYGIHFSTKDSITSMSGSSTCGDTIDNDGDTLADAADPSCIAGDGSYDPNLLELPKNQIVYTCSDGADNDGDTFMDAEDSSCLPNGVYNPNLAELAKIASPYPACSDGVDNNNDDGNIDINDPECHTDNDPNNTWSYDPTWNDESNATQFLWTECSNKNDDESIPDGLADYDDPQCHTDGDSNNIYSYNPNINSEGSISSAPDCLDGVDNDADGNIDNQDSSCYPDFNSSPSNSGAFDPNLSESRVAQCNDGIDNDGLGDVDIDDAECHTDNDYKNLSTYNPMNDDENKYSGLNWTACTNNSDDNGNGLTDYDEPNCHSDSNPNNPNSYNPNINDENDMNNIVLNSSPINNLLKNIFSPVSRFLSQAKKVFADDIIPSIEGDSKSFILFADVSCDGNPLLRGNKQYDYPNDTNATPCGFPSPEPAVCDIMRINAGVECMSITSIMGSNKVYGICINDECENGTIRKGTLDIVFTRPNPDAKFCYKDIAVRDCMESDSISHAGVIIQSLTDNRVKKVIVWNTGQISVN